MDLSIDDVIETFDDTYDIGTEDDQIKDTDIDQVFDENLNQEIAPAIIIDEYLIDDEDDEEKHSTDSDVTDLNTSDAVQKPSISHLPTTLGRGRGRPPTKLVAKDNNESPPPIILNVEQTSSVRGRGRWTKKAVDGDGNELPPPRILDSDPEPGFYSKPSKIATLPPSYYRKREDPKIRTQRVRTSPLIDFQASFNQISFITDKDDSAEKGYQHARKRLQQIFPDLVSDTSKPQHEILSFGLYIYSIPLPKPISCSLLELFPQKINNEENRPFWFMFKCLPIFKDPLLRNPTFRKPTFRNPNPENSEYKGTLIPIQSAIFADLSYGALTSMNRFHIHKDYTLRKRTKWSFRILDEFFEIQTNEFQKLCINDGIYSQVKHKITPDIIDRAAIFHLWNDGFSLFINMKGNVHELARKRLPRTDKNVHELPRERPPRTDENVHALPRERNPTTDEHVHELPRERLPRTDKNVHELAGKRPPRTDENVHELPRERNPTTDEHVHELPRERNPTTDKNVHELPRERNPTTDEHVHELPRERPPRTDKNVNEAPPERNLDNSFDPFIRRGIRDKPMPLFSTIRLRLRVKDDAAITASLEREGKIRKDTSIDKKNSLIETARDQSLKDIRETCKQLLDFFYKNRIHVCFGPIATRNISLVQLNTLNHNTFPTFVQSYSWAMLCSIGFRVQIQMFLAKDFVKLLHEYSKLRYDEKTISDSDDRFYRLCLYLHRRSSEYFFLDLNIEIQAGIEEYNDKYQRYKAKTLEIPKFDRMIGSTAYIPSVMLTPTTISIRPLKLCKLNRVLRETKRFGGFLNFALVELRDEAYRHLFSTEFRALKEQIRYYLVNGFSLTPERTYKYLHHSQSQVKAKQFWFYYHDKQNGYLSHEDAYSWMGNFDKERVVAKHTARIALNFTSTDATIQIPAEMVTYVRDVKDATGAYAFTDGVGTISGHLRDQIQAFLGRRSSFSVLQIRYGGCKGTLSVDHRLDNQRYQLRIRDSMNKFTTDHDVLELCKLSAPRALYLNRQDIVLLESRDIPHTHFLLLQNRYNFWLVRSLLSSATAYELLQEKLLPVFNLRKIARNTNIVEEQFFIKLIITCAFNVLREIIDRTRIRLPNTTARNMFGIVDEYGILEYGQVFFQYTNMRENKLNPKNDDESKYNGDDDEKCTIFVGKVVITKNPCHHPGDLRVFDAIDCPQLRHLKDCIVFPQKGHRPHSNEISGSDLDGDEYVVIWHEDLIPTTPNEDAYAYDSQEDPPKLDRPITREDINQVVLDVSEQDCLGSLSNIHLAYVDKEGIKSDRCTNLAGAISQEVDAAKTGKHPLTDKQIKELRDGLENKWPDFMKARGRKEYYPSSRVLGKLYRSARRSMIGWSRAINNHGNPRHIKLALELAAGTNINDEENDEHNFKINSSTIYEQPLDPHIYHPDYEKYFKDIRQLYFLYRNELLEIISLYHFQDEVDLFCRSDSMDGSGGSAKKGALEDSATIEVQNLIQRIKQDFYSEFDQRYEKLECCEFILKPNSNRRKRIDCKVCHEGKLAKAACAYIYTYQENNRLPLKSNRRILSFPWFFAQYLVELKYLNKPQDFVNPSDTLVGRALLLYLQNLTPEFKVFIPVNSIDIPVVQLFYEKMDGKRTSLLPINKTPDETIEDVPLLRACFVEVLNDWLIKQEIFGETCYELIDKPLIPASIWHELMVEFLSGAHHPKVRLISASKTQTKIAQRYREAIEEYRLRWTNKEFYELFNMFHKLHQICVRHIHETYEQSIEPSEQIKWSYLHEYIILALQCIGIEKRLVNKWIFPPPS